MPAVETPTRPPETEPRTTPVVIPRRPVDPITCPREPQRRGPSQPGGPTIPRDPRN